MLLPSCTIATSIATLLHMLCNWVNSGMMTKFLKVTLKTGHCTCETVMTSQTFRLQFSGYKAIISVVWNVIALSTAFV